MRERLLTVVEAAEVLKVKKNTVYDMIKRGDLKASKLGKQLRIRQEDLDEYIREVRQINHLDQDTIYAGSYLCIPYYSSEYK